MAMGKLFARTRRLAESQDAGMAARRQLAHSNRSSAYFFLPAAKHHDGFAGQMLGPSCVAIPSTGGC